MYNYSWLLQQTFWFFKEMITDVRFEKNAITMFCFSNPDIILEASTTLEPRINIWAIC